MQIPDFSPSGAIKSLLLSALIGAGGWTAHTLISTEGNTQVLAEHSRQLEKLEQGQEQTRSTLSDLEVTMKGIDGKLDVVNQKIDDDRRAARAARNGR